MHILDLWALFINQSTAPINALNIYSLYLLCLFMIYTRAVFRAEGSQRSHVCPGTSSAVKLVFLLVSLHKNMQTIILATSQYKTNSSSCQVCPIPTDSAAPNLREQTKIYFAAQKLAN